MNTKTLFRGNIRFPREWEYKVWSLQGPDQYIFVEMNGAKLVFKRDDEGRLLKNNLPDKFENGKMVYVNEWVADYFLERIEYPKGLNP